MTVVYLKLCQHVHAVHAVPVVYGVHAVFTLATAGRECCMAWHGDASCHQASFTMSHQAGESLAHTHGLTDAEESDMQIMTLFLT